MISLPGMHKTGYPVNDETMLLPAFVTGRKQPEPKPAEPARHHPERLPASERGMLVFVAALLGIGTIAVVVMLGMGGLSKPKTVAPPTPTPTGRAAGGAGNASLSPSPSPSLSPSPSVNATSHAPAPPVSTRHATHTASPKSSAKPSPSMLGVANPMAYCTATGTGTARPPRNGQGWTCVDSNHHKTPMTPAQVCTSQYGAGAYPSDTSPTALTWRCYR